MTEPTDRPTDATDDEEIDDPGRDPRGLNPPRNLFGGGPETGPAGKAGDDVAESSGEPDEPDEAADSSDEDGGED